MTAITMFQVGVYIFASICVCAVLIMVIMWIGFQFEEALDNWRDRQKIKKQVRKLK